MSSNKMYEIGDSIQWNWMGGIIKGEILEIYHQPVTKEIKGKSIKRNGSSEKPAFLVRSEAGNLALKLVTEISRRSNKKSAAT
ncbi:MAG: DUF2945 domain-containing protein [Bdellovibrionales bacterium]|nr:DUF2945 domain-containing protein [Bdellovibrionales bacterium]